MSQTNATDQWLDKTAVYAALTMGETIDLNPDSYLTRVPGGWVYTELVIDPATSLSTSFIPIPALIKSKFNITV